jgi:integrase
LFVARRFGLSFLSETLRFLRHGLRKSCVTRLADIEGMDVLSLASISGHKDLRELLIYIDAADRKRRARRAIEHLEKAQKRNTKVSKRATRLDKSTEK